MISLKKREKGFTLIELMIVVAIIGILAAIAIPKFADLVTKSREANVKGLLGSIRSALSIYYGDTEGAYPTNAFALAWVGKYMPLRNGVEDLGNATIPAVSGQNPGHAFATVTASELQQDDGTGATSDTDAFRYVNVGTSLRYGDLWVACTHKDTKSTAWTAY